MGAQKEITISGVGGQGMILCGTLIAQAAVLYDHKKATLSSEYGTEARGTFARSDVIVSTEEIYFPDVTEPDLIVCLHQKAYERYSGKTDEKCLLVYDLAEVEPDPAQASHEVGIDISERARALGNPATANIITMGIIAGKEDAVSPGAAYQVLESFFGKKGEKVVAMNKKAFDLGYELGKDLKKA